MMDYGTQTAVVVLGSSCGLRLIVSLIESMRASQHLVRGKIHINLFAVHVAHRKP